MYGKRANEEFHNTTATGDLDQVLIEIAEINVSDADNLGLFVEAVAQAFDQFQVRVKFHPDDTYADNIVASTAADYTSPISPMRDCSRDMTAIPAGESGWLRMDVRGIHSVQVLAACAADNGGAIVRGGAQ